MSNHRRPFDARERLEARVTLLTIVTVVTGLTVVLEGCLAIGLWVTR